jgi:uncharacterized RDD family membrane protein YckC
MDSRGAPLPAQVRLLETPEGVTLSLEIASVGARLGAFLIDMLLVLSLIIVVGLTLFLTGIGTERETVQQFLGVAFLVSLFILRNFWFILFEMGPRSATPGKRFMKIRVIAREGGRLEARSVVARNLLRDVELFLPLGFLLSQIGTGGVDALTGWLGFGWTMLFLFFPLFNRDRMRAGDMLAGTWVVSLPKNKAGLDLTEGPRVDARRFPFTEDHLAAYGAYELQTLEGLLRGENEASLALVSETIRAKIGWPYEYDDRAFLTAYYTAVRARLEQNLLFGKRKRDKFDH